MSLGERAAEHGEILGEDVDHTAVDGAPAGDDAVAGDFGLLHAKIDAAVLDIHVELLEGAFVEQKLEPFPRRELAARVLRLDALEAAAFACPSRRISSSSRTSFMPLPKPLAYDAMVTVNSMGCERRKSLRPPAFGPG